VLNLDAIVIKVRSPPVTSGLSLEMRASRSRISVRRFRLTASGTAPTILEILAAAGCNYVMGVPCADDIMLNYQSTSYHDAAAVREVFELRPAPEFLT
jgi:hypothetical protein